MCIQGGGHCVKPVQHLVVKLAELYPRLEKIPVFTYQVFPFDHQAFAIIASTCSIYLIYIRWTS